jgi:hypothetical protein
MYYLFCGLDNYHPSGGALDHEGTFDTIPAAKTYANNIRKEWAHIATADRGMVIVSEWMRGNEWRDRVNDSR